MAARTRNPTPAEVDGKPMAKETGTAVSHLRWPGAALLPPALRESLAGAGASQ